MTDLSKFVQETANEALAGLPPSNTALTQLQEPMACGHPKACLVEDHSCTQEHQPLASEPCDYRSHCTACEHEKLAVAGALAGVKDAISQRFSAREPSSNAWLEQWRNVEEVFTVWTPANAAKALGNMRLLARLEGLTENEALHKEDLAQREAQARLEGFASVQREHAEVMASKSFGDPSQNIGEIIALMHTELSEAFEAVRHGNPADDKVPAFSGIEAEMADVILRIMHAAEVHEWRVWEAVLAKLEYNKTRAYKHGGKQC